MTTSTTDDKVIDNWISNSNYFRSSFLKSSVIYAHTTTPTGDPFFTESEWASISVQTATLQYFLKGLIPLDDFTTQIRDFLRVPAPEAQSKPPMSRKPLPNYPFTDENPNDKLLAPFFF